MKYTVLLSQEAEWDIYESFHWYEMQKSSLGDSFEKAINDGLNAISQNPNICQLKYKKLRIFFTKDFPFGIHYFIDKKELKVIAVFHTSKDPSSWDERIKKNLR